MGLREFKGSTKDARSDFRHCISVSLQRQLFMFVNKATTIKREPILPSCRSLCSDGFICNFAGVECWHPNENRVLNIKLPSMGLQGGFPADLVRCTSMTGLDLSDNQFSGPLPTNISSYIGYWTSLDLSKNQFTGEIPDDIRNCTYLNVLKLDYNQFTGKIPSGIGLLSRLKTFSVAGNKLTGNIPPFRNPQPSENFANNEGLCGFPLTTCEPPANNGRGVDIAAIVSGGILFIALLIIIVMMLFCLRKPKISLNYMP